MARLLKMITSFARQEAFGIACGCSAATILAVYDYNTATRRLKSKKEQLLEEIRYKEMLLAHTIECKEYLRVINQNMASSEGGA